MASNPMMGDYAHALEADDGFQIDRARTQVMNSESLGTYQRPLHVFKYMHLHEYMKARPHPGATGVLGSGATVRDTKRTLHIGSKEEDQDDGKKQERKKQHRRGGSRAKDGHHKDQGDAMAVQDGGSANYFVPPEFINKGFYVWDAVRREWRGPADVAEAARTSRKIQRAAEGGGLGSEEIEAQLSDPQQRKFTKKVPLKQLIQVLDVVWQGEGTL